MLLKGAPALGVCAQHLIHFLRRPDVVGALCFLAGLIQTVGILHREYPLSKVFNSWAARMSVGCPGQTGATSAVACSHEMASLSRMQTIGMVRKQKNGFSLDSESWLSVPSHKSNL